MRIQGVRALCFSLLLFVVGCLPLLGEDPWMFRGNPAHSGVYDGAGLAKLRRAQVEVSYWRDGDWIGCGVRWERFISAARMGIFMR